MEDIEALKRTFSRFLENLAKIDGANTFRDLDKVEVEIVRTLQLMEAEIGYTGRGVYDLVQARRNAIRSGEIKEEKNAENDKPSDAGRSKRRTSRKVK